MGGKGCRQPFGDKWGNWNVHDTSDSIKLVFIFLGTRVVIVGCYITHHRLGVLKQQKFISHCSGGWGVWHQGAGLTLGWGLASWCIGSRLLAVLPCGEGVRELPEALSGPSSHSRRLHPHDLLVSPRSTSYDHLVGHKVSAHEFRVTQVLGSSSLQKRMSLFLGDTDPSIKEWSSECI